ncbi:hypothetical protein A1O3_08107 [Capronia epimyces CBS 606.96]|uniref:Uncharacterized protein n=1 Tax=Capronia epimyces CBS 606.96 TaxID=1182542 RepID=W9XH29_9EURO|nr:uncharacterized protein A1O3_08107 [Capronia epimyces CBS 606.96]EXJ79822.1 hypothetical protein A1O3_08107 [Capronia epimyces CBS 606.96]
MSQDSISDSGSSDSGVSDLRRRMRDTRPRPWLNNSVLRRRSTATSSSGLDGGADAPALPESTTVPIVSDLPSSTTVLGCGQSRDNTKKERDSSRLSRAAAKAATSIKALAKCAGSKIPQWVGLKGVLSRSCPPPLDRDGVLGKGKSTAASPTRTGEKTFASRLPVRFKRSLAGRRPASQQVRLSQPQPLVASTGGKGKEAGKRGTGGFWGVLGRHAEPDQSCFKPEPIRTHRREHQLTSILKHQGEHSGKGRPAAQPTTPASHDGGRKPGVEEKPGKKVVVLEIPTFSTPARHWPRGLIKAWVCGGCRNETGCVCPATSRHADGLRLGGREWVKDQLHKGYDYLELSGGMLSGIDRLPS